jgi:hypothetical protein
MSKEEESSNSNLLEKFAEWGTSDDFNRKVDLWMEVRNVIHTLLILTSTHTRRKQKNADETFRDASPKGEQKLHWGQKFSEYNDWLEEELESFCDCEDVSPESVFSSLKNGLKREKEKEARWFPIFMSNTIYENFLHEMRSRARELDILSDATHAAVRVENDVNISGVWYHDPKYLDRKTLSRLMKLAKLPWIFRKLFSTIASTRNISIIIEQTEDYVRLTQKFKFFGSSETLLRWERPTRVYNFWRKICTCTATLKKNRIEMKMTDLDYYPEGSCVCHTWKINDDGDLIFTMGVDLPDDGEKIRLSFHMRRERSGK